MSGSSDIINWIIDWMRQNETAITEDLALRCEREARAEWGGRTIDWIPKTCAADRRAREEARRAAHADLLGPEPIDAIVRRRGLSRATLYRLTKRPPAQK